MAVADCAIKRQRLIVEVERLLPLAKRIVDKADAEKRVGFFVTFAGCAIKRQRLS